jgi:hypothetical protein
VDPNACPQTSTQYWPVGKRLALTEEQVESHDLARLAIPKSDKRYRPPRTHDAIETEALSQRIILDIVEERLAYLLPERLERVLEREREERAELGYEEDEEEE